MKPRMLSFRVVEPRDVPDEGSPARGICVALVIMAGAFAAVVAGMHIAARVMAP